MRVRRSLSVARRIFLGLRHDPRTVALILLGPIVAMFVFGLAFSGDVRHVRVGVVDLDAGMELPFIGTMSLSARIVDNLDPAVIEAVEVESEAIAESMVRDGKLAALVVFPEGFTENVHRALDGSAGGASARIRIRLDRTVFNVAAAVTRSFMDAVMTTVRESGRELPVSVDTDDPIYGRGASFMDFFVPGVMGFAGFMLTALLTILSFVAEKRGGTLDRLLATPLSEGELVAGYAAAFGLIGVVQALLLLGVAVAAFNVMIVGTVALAFFIIALLCVVSLSLGILLSTLAESELQAIQMIPLIVLPSFLLAGIFWPVEAIPPYLRPLSYLIPPYWAIDACRSIMIRGWGIGRIYPHALVLAAFAAVFLRLAVLTLRRRKS
ncbi:MAG: ABC transporter permease [Spirochaetota bacterium]|jgi:ABC-2 type transport system permease protein